MKRDRLTVSFLFPALLLAAGLFFVQGSVSLAQYTCGFDNQYEYDPASDTCWGYEPNSGEPPVLDLTATPSTIQQGQSSTLTWGWDRDMSQAGPPRYNCTINGGVGPVSPFGGGTRVVSPSVTTTYTISCVVSFTYYNFDVEHQYYTEYTDSETVTVTQMAPPTATLVANPTSITSGGTSTLTLSSTNATSCTGTGFNTGGATSGNFSVTPPATTNYSVTCTGLGGTANAYATVTVTAPHTQPNLTVSNASPTTARRNVSTTFTATVSNTGTQGTGAGYTTTFEILGWKSPVIGTVSSSVTNAGDTRAVSASATFSADGNYTLRICTDSGNQIGESNEGDNCSNTPISVTQVINPNGVSCLPGTQSGTLNQPVSWTASASGDAGPPFRWYDALGTLLHTGSTLTKTYATQGTYGVYVTASSGSGTVQSSSCQVTIGGGAEMCPAGTADLTITASPNRVRQGETSTITWNAQSVGGPSASCTVSGPGVSESSGTLTPPSCSYAGSETPTITTQSVYTLTCGSQSQSVIVNVIPRIIEF